MKQNQKYAGLKVKYETWVVLSLAKIHLGHKTMDQLILALIDANKEAKACKKKEV